MARVAIQASGNSNVSRTYSSRNGWVPDGPNRRKRADDAATRPTAQSIRPRPTAYRPRQSVRAAAARCLAFVATLACGFSFLISTGGLSWLISTADIGSIVCTPSLRHRLRPTAARSSPPDLPPTPVFRADIGSRGGPRDPPESLLNRAPIALHLS